MTEPVPGAVDCEAVVRALWDYLDGELPEARLAEIGAHLRECLRCRTHAEFEARLLAEIAAVRTDPADPAALERRVRAALAADAARSSAAAAPDPPSR